MKALSVRPPWSHLIIHGAPILESVPAGEGRTRIDWLGKGVIKDIENRSWCLPKNFDTPQRIYIHAGKRRVNISFERFHELAIAPGIGLMLFGDIVARGAIIGEVDLVGCVHESDNPWFEGPHGFVLENPVAYEKPIPYKGKLGFFEVELEVTA